MTNEVCAATDSGECSDILGKVSSQFSTGRELWEQFLSWLTDKGVEFAVNAIAAVVILLLGWLAIGLICRALKMALNRRKFKNALIASFITSAVSKVLWAVLIVVVLGKLGVNIAPIIAGLGVTGFILGFAFQESLGNLASGLMIALNEPFKVGDYVILAGLEGTILEVNMMATVLATADNKKIVVPNKSAWGSPITNFSALDKRRVDLKVGIDYGADIAKAKEVALRVVKSLPAVLAEPAPIAEVSLLDDSAVVLTVRPWVKTADYWKVYFAASQGIKEAFDAAGVQIPFPQLTVHLDSPEAKA